MSERALMLLVDEQANDDGLWFEAEYFTEDYLQRALRRLHEAIEGEERAHVRCGGTFIKCRENGERQFIGEPCDGCQDCLGVSKHKAVEVTDEAELFHEVMECLRKMRMTHGLCEPRSRRACAHCNGADRLQEIVTNYKGRRVVLA